MSSDNTDSKNNGSLNRQDHGCCCSNKKTWFDEMRGWIMIVAVQVAAATYASGLTPPGGFWPDDGEGHTAGYAILHDKSKHRYTTFYYANATAFMASLVVIVLIMNERFYGDKSRVVVLNINVVLCLVSLMVAYAAGSARMVSTSIFVVVLSVGVLLFVLFSPLVLQPIFKFIIKKFPGLKRVLGADLVESLTGSKDETEQHNGDNDENPDTQSGKTNTTCPNKEKNDKTRCFCVC